MEKINTRKELLKKKCESDIFNIKKTLLNKVNIIESKKVFNIKKSNNNIVMEPKENIGKNKNINEEKSFKLLKSLKLINENSYDTSNIKSFSKDYYKDPNNQDYSKFFRKRMNSSNFEFNLKSSRKNELRKENTSTFTPKYKNFNPSNLKAREFSTTIKDIKSNEKIHSNCEDSNLNLSVDQANINQCNQGNLNSFYNSYVKNSNNIRGYFNSEQKYINKEHYNYHNPNLTAFQRKFAQDYSNCDFVKVDLDNIKKVSKDPKNKFENKKNCFNQTFSIFKKNNFDNKDSIKTKNIANIKKENAKKTIFDDLGKKTEYNVIKNKNILKQNNSLNGTILMNDKKSTTIKKENKNKEKLLQINSQTNQIYSTFVDKDFHENEVIKQNIKNEISKKFNNNTCKSKVNKQYDLSSINQNPRIFNTECKFK